MKKIKTLFALLTVVIAALAAACGGHTHEYISKDIGLTCTTDGVRTFTCECGDSYTEPLTATGHTFNDGVCTVCGEYDFITVAEALELCGESGNITEERYYVRATVESITNPTYGQMVIKDETGSISVYGTYSADGEFRYDAMEEKPYKGDEVILHCILQNYNGDKEIKNARLISFKSNAGNVDEKGYTEMSIEQAREAADGAKVKVDGVVAQIVYAFGPVPCGVYLVDETQSIYVYDGDLAARVEKGNTVTILATKDYWILEKERENAAKFGYQGCNQLTEVTLVSNDEKTGEFDKSWIEESTVKEILETPVSEDITTSIYKVNALVKKVPGTGFTNYYFYDLDGETGGYTYSQCSGGDFAWVDEFDGKICTVYLSAMNAKSEATSCFFRFLPVAIVDEDFAFDLTDAGEFAVKYFGVDQFEKEYYADPAREMVTSVSSDLLGFSGATISYSSSNTNAVYFETVGDKTVMHCKDNGRVTITVTGSYGSYTAYEQTVEVEVLNPDNFDTITVADAIEAEIDDDVLVRGIVGPSVVNKNGFYLFGADGSMIAVLVKDTSEFKGLEIGNEVILEGRRERHVKDDNASYAGQTCIMEADILVNLYGENEYSTEKFVTGTSVSGFRALDVTVDYSTTVFVIEAKIEFVETPHYTSLKVTGDGTNISLYCSGAGQYSFLKAYSGQTVTLEVAACNWNDKTYWAGCALAVRTADGKVYNTLNFDIY